MITQYIHNSKLTSNFCRQKMELIEYFKQIQKINKSYKIKMNSKIVYKKMKIYLIMINKKMKKLQRKKLEK